MFTKQLLIETNLTRQEAELLGCLLAARAAASVESTIEKSPDGFLIDEYAVIFDENTAEWVLFKQTHSENHFSAGAEELAEMREVFAARNAASLAGHLFTEIQTTRIEMAVSSAASPAPATASSLSPVYVPNKPFPQAAHDAATESANLAHLVKPDGLIYRDETPAPEEIDSREITAVLVVRLNSTLEMAELKRRLVVALWDEDTGNFTPDNTAPELEVIEYDSIELIQSLGAN